MISVPIRNGRYIFDMISHFVRWYMPYGTLRNGYYIIFSRSGNISYSKAVYHISQEIYHFWPAENNLFFGRFLTYIKVYNPLWHFHQLKVSFFLYIEKRRQLPYGVCLLKGCFSYRKNYFFFWRSFLISQITKRQRSITRPQRSVTKPSKTNTMLTMESSVPNVAKDLSKSGSMNKVQPNKKQERLIKQKT